MPESEAFWVQLSAVSQVAAALGTFAAVIVSLWLGLKSNKPKIKLIVGERMFIGPLKEHDENVLMFSLANTGSRPARITNLGWNTGWLKRGPAFLRKQYAVQTFGGTSQGLQVPFELPVGLDGSCYAELDNFHDWLRNKTGPPFFTREVPFLGRVRTRVRAYAVTADGHQFSIKPEKSFLEKVFEIETEKSD